MENYVNFECKWIPKEDLWQTVRSFREKYWPENTLPVDMEKIIEQGLRLSIEPIHSLLDDLDVDAFLKLDLSGIVVDYDCFMQERFQNRIRFSFAHEVGHFVLHKDIYEKVPFTSPEEWKYSVLNIADKEYRNFEWQANEFAGRLLVPREKLIVEIKKIYKMIEESGIRQYLSDDPGAVLSRVSPVLCKPFGVSENVIERRVEREGLCMATYLIKDKKGQKKKVDKKAPKDFKKMMELVKRFPSNVTSFKKPKEHLWSVAK